MKWFASLSMLFFWAAAGMAEEPVAIPLSASFAATMRLEGIYELEDGNLRVAITDKQDSSTFSLKVGETNAAGIALLDVDYDQEWATLEKDGLTVQLRMHGATTTTRVTPAEKEERIHQAEARRMSYAERRKLRQQELANPRAGLQPVKAGEVKEQRLQEYQMEVIRQGLSAPPPPPR